MSTFLHVDINSYFATMLQQKYPKLRGKPVGIVKETGRTCIIAASKEAKFLGVATGCNAREARRLIPGLILRPAEFDFYLDNTKRLKHLFESLSPRVEIFSLDEAFIDISDCQQYLYPDAYKFAQHIQSEIKIKLGEWVTCNVGIAKNRFLAKLASEISPKGSITTVTPDNVDRFLAIDNFSSVCGIGFRLEARLRALGVTSLYSINFLSDQDLKQHFGPFWSIQLRLMARGEEPHFFSLIDKNPHMKSIGRSITGYQLEDDEANIKRILYNLTEEVIYKTRKQNLVGRQVYIYLTGEDKHWGGHLTLNYYLNHTREMFNLIYYHLYCCWQRNFKIIRFAVGLSLLKPLSQTSLSLLPGYQKHELVHTAIDKIWHRHGLFSVTSALLKTKNSIIRPEVTGFLGDKKFQLEI